MERVAFDAVEPGPSTGAATARRLSDALDADTVAINHYSVASDERVSGLHAHGDQEEIFVVLDGTATIETLDGVVQLESSEVLRFPPGEYQSVRNEHAEPVELLAIGAPPESEDVRIPLPCPDCGHEFRRPSVTESGPVLQCPACGAQEAATCSNCGGESLCAVLGPNGDPVSSCSDCGMTEEH